MARRSSQPKELVRLSPLQFSLSVSIVVILLGGAGFAGYYYGLRQAQRPNYDTDESSNGGIHEGAESKPQTSGTESSVTFYSALTEPRKEVPAVAAREPLVKGRNQGVIKPVAPPEATSEIRDPVPGNASAMLQVASYKDQASAQKLLEDLLSDGYSGTVLRADLGERGIWYRVRIGPYAQGEEAELILKRLREERGLKGYVVK